MKLTIRQFNQQIELEVEDNLNDEDYSKIIYRFRQIIINGCPDLETEEGNTKPFKPASEKQKQWCKVLGCKDVDSLSYDDANSYIREHKK